MTGQSDTAKRILVVQTAFLGDVVLTLPLIAALCRHFAPARVDVLTVPAHAPLLRQQPGVDGVVVYDKRGAQRGVRGLWHMGRYLRARRYDVVVSPHRSLRSALLVASSGSPQRVGFTRWLTRWAYTATIPRPTTGHEVERNLQLCRVLEPAAAPGCSRLGLAVAPEARQRALALYAAHGIAVSTVVIGVIPGSQWGTKRWPAERFAMLLARLAALPQTHVALFGGPQERSIVEAITAVGPVPFLDLVGKTPLQDLPAYLERCRMVVSNDTGPMHIAAALGKPVVVLYGPTTPDLGFYPYGVPWEDASVTLACRPCHAHGPHRCPRKHWRCMRELTVEQVCGSVLRLLAGDAATAGARS